MICLGQSGRRAILAIVSIIGLLLALSIAGPALAQKDEILPNNSDAPAAEQTISKPDAYDIDGDPVFRTPDAALNTNFDDADIAMRAERIVQSRGTQSALPEDVAPPELPNWNLAWLVPILRIIGWLVVAAFVVGLLVLIFVMFSNTRFDLKILRRGKNETDGNLQRPVEDEPLWSRDALSLADQLAADGKYAEAVHALLLGSLGDLKARFFANLPSSLTSREIVAKIPIVTVT